MTLFDSQFATTFMMGGITFRTLVSPSRGATDNAVWRLTVAPGVIAEGQHQVTREEVFYALAGEARIHLDGEAMTLREGCALLVKPGQNFSLSNPGALVFEALVVLPVGGMAQLPGQAPFIPPWAR